MSSADRAAGSDTPAIPVPLFDISRQHAELEQEISASLTAVCSSGKFVLGPDVVQLEAAMTKLTGAKHAIACASGSDALLLALMAYDIGPGDEVICPSYTFFATASAVTRLGATPVFVDIEPDTCNLDVAQVSRRVTSMTRAIIPVHLYGQCADMQPIVDMARLHGLAVIEDACQAIGAEYRGRQAGAIGDIGCFSYYPTKNLGAYGDAGMLTTNNDKLADKLQLLRGHGMRPRYYHKIIGINSRLDSLQAAVLNVKLPHLERWTKARRTRADRYTAEFMKRGLTQFLRLPTVRGDRKHVWNQYVVHVAGGKRDALRAYLADRKIGTEVYYPVPLHQQECFSYLGYGAGSLPYTEAASVETVALPIFPELRDDEQQRVIEAICEFFLPAGQSATEQKGALGGPNFLKARDGARSSERI
ncbi:MAG: DegT/DnrJ/EryC1/StrS family aminotransferase [Pirellulales bacterium]